MKRYDLELTATGPVMEEREQGAFVPFYEVSGLVEQLADATRQCGVMTGLLREVIVRDDFDRDDGESAGRLLYRIDSAIAGKLPDVKLSTSTNWPDKCPITRRAFFMEIDGVPTYGGPYDS